MIIKIDNDYDSCGAINRYNNGNKYLTIITNAIIITITVTSSLEKMQKCSNPSKIFSISSSDSGRSKLGKMYRMKKVFARENLAIPTELYSPGGE